MKQRMLKSLGLAASFLVGGCASSPPSTFYQLTPIVGQQATTADRGDSPLVIGVGPVRMPEYLDRPQIVVREAPNRLVLNEVHRWGGSLQDNLLLVLTQNLSLLLGTDQVLIYPWDDPLRPDYQVRLELRRFDGTAGSDVELDARWSLTARESEPAAKGRSLVREPVQGDGYSALVAAQSRALGRLSRDVEAEIRALEQRRLRSGE